MLQTVRAIRIVRNELSGKLCSTILALTLKMNSNSQAITVAGVSITNLSTILVASYNQ